MATLLCARFAERLILFTVENFEYSFRIDVLFVPSLQWSISGIHSNVQLVTKVMTPGSMYFLWKQGS